MKMKTSGKSMGIPAGIAIGTLISLLVSMAGAAISAWLVSSEKIGEGGIGYAACGAWFSASMIKRLRLQMCMLCGGCYLLCLLGMTALFFGGQYQSIGSVIVTILCGSGIVALAPMKKKEFQPKAKGDIGNLYKLHR